MLQDLVHPPVRLLQLVSQLLHLRFSSVCRCGIEGIDEGISS